MNLKHNHIGHIGVGLGNDKISIQLMFQLGINLAKCVYLSMGLHATIPGNGFPTAMKRPISSKDFPQMRISFFKSLIYIRRYNKWQSIPLKQVS